MKQQSPTPNQGADVTEFALWWLRNKEFKIPDLGAVRWFDGVAGITLFRDGQFQVQLFIVGPNRGSPKHHHPNIDSVEYSLSGAGTFSTARNLFRGGLMLVAPNEDHVAAAGDGGGAFISVQKWINGVAPSSVEQDWVGAPIDETHARQIGGSDVHRAA